MAKGLITHAYLEDTADAIRVLRGESDTYTPDEFGEKILDAIPTEEVTDNIVSITDAAAYPAEGLEFAIEPVQDLHGYDKPWPGGGGKNLINATDVTITVQSVIGTIVLDAGVYSFSCHIKDTTNISGSVKISNAYGVIIKQIIFSAGVNETVKVENITIESDDTTIAFIVSGSTSGYSYQCSEIQCEKGSTATSYAPYSNICPISGWTGVQGKHSGADTTQYTEILVSFPAEAGTVYGGKVDVVNGKLTVERTSKIITSASRVNVSSGLYYIAAIISPSGVNSDRTHKCLSDKFVDNGQTVNEGNIYITNSGNIVVFVGPQTITTKEEADAWLVNNPVQLVYELATPIEYDITPQQVMMLLGDNNVWCDTGDTTLEYKVDLGHFIAKLQAAQAPQLSLSRHAVSLDEGAEDVEVSADEPIEESEKAEEMPAEDVESVDVAEDEPAELPVEEDTEAESTESEIWVKEPDTFEKEGDESD